MRTVIGRLFYLLEEFHNKYLRDRLLEITVIMSLITVLLFMQHSRLLMGVIFLLIPVAILFKEIALSRVYWVLLSLLMTIGFLPLYFTADNHTFLTLYWIFAVALSLWFTDRYSVLSHNARILIGLCFLFATLWKLMSPEFLEGDFFLLTFLTDSRFFDFAELTAGITPELRSQNLSVFENIIESTNRTESGNLQSTGTALLLSKFMAYWTVFIEGWIAIAFLLPRKKAISKYRDIPLIIFMFTTYPIATVRGFATLLAVMGFAQCGQENKIMRIAYLSIFVLIPVFSLPFERILMDLINMFT